MASIHDWADRAAEFIIEDGCAKKPSDRERLAAVISRFAHPIVSLLLSTRRPHAFVCPCYMEETDEIECTCGASKWNKRIDKSLE